MRPDAPSAVGLAEADGKRVGLLPAAAGRGGGERSRFGSGQMPERRAHQTQQGITPRRIIWGSGLRLVGARDHERDLAAFEVRFGGRACGELAERAAISGLEYFGEFTRDGSAALGSEHRRAIGETCRDAVRRLEIHQRPRLVREQREARASLGRFSRQKAFETETVGGDARDAQGGGDRGRTGNRAHLDPDGSRAAHEIEAGVRQQRRAGVADEGDHRTGLETREQIGAALALVVRVQRNDRLGDAERREQLTGAARILGCDQIGSGERLTHAWCEITKIANRCRHHVEASLRSHYNHAPAIESDGHRARRREAIQSMRLAKFPRFACALLALSVVLSACATAPAAPVASREHAALLAARGEHSAAAAEYEAAAALSPAIGNELLLLAAREWLRVPQPAAADAALARLAPPLDANQNFEREVIGAESALLADDAPRGWTKLTALAVPTQAANAATYHALRQRLALAVGKPLEAIRSARDRETLAIDDAQRVAIRKELFDGLRAAGERGLRFDPRSAGKDSIARGWLEAAPLAARLGGIPQATAMSLTAGWRGRYPSHPAAALMLELARGSAVPVTAKPTAAPAAAPTVTASTPVRTSATPAAPPPATPSPATPPPPLPAGSHVAVLLPLTGRNASAGLQLRDGLLSAYYGDDAPDRVTLRFYDTGAQSIAQALGAANAAGASFVIGPLTRDEVNAAADAAPRIPVLALNFLTAEHAPPARFRQFGLSPEDEARAVAKRVLADGRRRGIVFAPAGEWSERVVRAFKEEFTAGGGNVLDVQFLTGTKETATAIQGALRIDDSKARHDRLQRILGTTLAFQPRRRGDLDFLFTPAPSAFARQLRPQLQFFFAGDIPAYATADAFDPAAGAQIDLDGVLLPDMPWIVQRDDAGYARLRAEAADAFGNDVPARGRLFALGHDAWRLQGLLRSNEQTVTLDGLTGALALDANGRIQRTLEWARIDDGVPKPLEDKP